MSSKNYSELVFKLPITLKYVSTDDLFLPHAEIEVLPNKVCLVQTFGNLNTLNLFILSKRTSCCISLILIALLKEQPPFVKSVMQR